MKRVKIKEMAVLLIFLTGSFFSCTKNNSSLSLNGTWHVEENSQLYGTQHYDAQITQFDSTKLEIANFYNLGADTYVSAIMDEANITIPQQGVNGYTIQGTGTVKYDYRSITFHFTASDGTVQDVVVAQYKK